MADNPNPSKDQSKDAPKGQNAPASQQQQSQSQTQGTSPHAQTPGQTAPASGQVRTASGAPGPPAANPAGAATGSSGAAPTATGSPQGDTHLAHTLAQTLALVQAQQNAPAMPREDADEMVEGGKYIIDGVEYNAWGKPYKEGQKAHDDNPELTRFNRPA